MLKRVIAEPMAQQQRWLRIIPVALLMYTISYVDRTNVSLALDPNISGMMRDLGMDPEMKGEAAGMFFLGYVLLQMAGGYMASHWSPRKLISLCLVGWGFCAMGCGLAQTFRQFEVVRFFLGMAESGVFPAMLVLLANWFPRAERARANGYWNLCQPLAVVASMPLTAWLLGRLGWRQMMIIEGILPFIWLPVWWLCIRDHPRAATWISAEERAFLEDRLRRETAQLEPVAAISLVARCCRPSVLLMVAIYFLHNCAAYGCMTFFTSGLNGHGFSTMAYGILFALPYAVTAVVMVINSWHSDKTHERRGHVAVVYLLSGMSLILSVSLSRHFWLSYAFLCMAIPGPFAAMAPFWAIPTETLPRGAAGPVMGLVNAFGNLGGFAGPFLAGRLTKLYHNTSISFDALGVGMVIAAVLSLWLPKAAADVSAGRMTAAEPPPAPGQPA